MGFFSDAVDFVGDAISWGVEKVGDAFEWVGDKIGDVWDSNIGKIVIIAAAAYFAFAVLPQMAATTSVEAAAGTGVASAGAETIAVAAPGLEATAAVAGTEAAAAAEVAAMGGGVAGGGGAGGVLAGTEAAAAGVLEPVSAGAIDLTLAGGAEGAAAGLAGAPSAAAPGVLESVGAFASEHPMMTFGGMMVGGQAVSGYMAGEQQKEMEEQRIAEENAARNRQNVWGVNYGEGGEPISAGAALEDLNQKYFNSATPEYTQLNPYLLPSEREQAGALDEITSMARPAEMYAHRTRA